MSEIPQPSYDALSFDLACAVDDACWRFERAWQTAQVASQRPRIDDYVNTIPEPGRPVLLRELVALDIAYRRRNGEEPQAADYAIWFPGLDPAPLREVLSAVGAVRPMTEQTRLNALLLRHEELRAQGTPVSPEELCQDCPELLDQLKPRLRELESMNALLGAASEEASAASTKPDRSRPDFAVPWSSAAVCTSSRYQILGLHARGGLGEVHLARDEELHREVALKRLQTLRASDTQSRDRFRREAALTSRLEHPNIVPIHSMGEDADGCPFYAMRFIQGQTLREAIEQFHAPNGPSRTTGECRLALRQLLGRVVAVCNTLAYAHSKGIVHRDIKPANIMLGPYGETLVVDWGLAKEVGAPEKENAPVPPEVIASESDDPALARCPVATATGMVLGTPPYMSPEQASGRSDRVSPASDVYSLGVTLYTVLTGQPPFHDCQTIELLDQVRRGEFPPPRHRNPAIPRALEAICLKAMALNPEDRYATAKELAADVEQWLADEPVSAYRDGPAARLARWGRRHRPLVIGAAALLVTAVGLLAAGIVLINQEKDRTKAAYVDLEREQDRTQEALSAEARRRKQTRDALDLLSSQIIDEWLAKQKELLPVHRKFLEKAVASYEELAHDTGEDEASRAGMAHAYGRVAAIRRRLGQTEEAEHAFRRSRDLYQQLTADFPDTPKYRKALAWTHGQMGHLLLDASRTEAAEATYRSALELRQQLATDFPTVAGYTQDLGESHFHLGYLFYRAGRKELSEQSYLQTLALCQKLVDAHPEVAQYAHNLAQSQLRMGLLYKATDRPEPARQAYQAACAIWQRLADAHPDVPDYQDSQADCYNNLATLDGDAGHTVSAEQNLLRARKILQHRADANPQIPLCQFRLALVQRNLGIIYADEGRAGLAEQAFQQARVVYQHLVDTHPENVDYTVELGHLCWNLGHLLAGEEPGRPEEELKCYAQGIRALEAFPQKESQQPMARLALLSLYGARAQALAMLGRHAEAAHEIERAREIHQVLSGSNVRYFGRDYFLSYRARVRVLAGDHDRATADVEEIVKATPLQGDFYYLGCTYALAASAGQQDSRLPEGERAKLHARYAARAVDLLRKAHTAGEFRNPAAIDRLRTAKELAVLRSREDFQKLVKEVEEHKQPDGP